ncbi:MAG: hypothetical protein U0V87_01910 [Acidobacteriota bacterium]
MSSMESTVREQPRSIFELLTAYHSSLDNMRLWLSEAEFSDVERIAIVDAWQAEIKQWFSENGYCFVCSKPLARCDCN